VDLRGITIDDVVPHRGAMRLVDRLLACDANHVVVAAEIRIDHPFASDTGVPGWLGIEYMAQAIAAWSGCRARRRKVPVQMGFLLGSRRYQCARSQFAFGTQLRIEAHCELFDNDGMGMFSCRILIGDEAIAQANLAVFEPQDPTFLESQTR